MKTAIVTGASSGLGKAFVYQLAKEKGIEAIWMIARSQDKMQQIQTDLESLPIKCTILPLDLSLSKSIASYEAYLKEKQPEIVWLVNAAGFGKMGTNEEIGLDALNQMIDLDAKAAVDMTQASLPYMVKNSHIVEIASTAAFMPLGGLGVYSASKAFLLSYSRTLHMELLPRGIKVTAVCPYWIKDTNFIPVCKDAQNDKAVKHFPLASKTKSVLRWAYRDCKLGLSVSTPGIVCTLHRLICKFIPRTWLMYAWEILRRI